MNAQQRTTYYESLAIRVGSNAILRIETGNVDQAGELARNAAKFAFAAYPELRGEEIPNPELYEFLSIVNYKLRNSYDYSVNLHFKTINNVAAGAIDIGDFATKEDAFKYAETISKQYNFPIHCDGIEYTIF